MKRLGYVGQHLQAHRWVRSLTGVEYGKVQTWGGHPDNEVCVLYCLHYCISTNRSAQRDIATASPCRYIDLPQTLVEPLLVRYATDHGFPIRFNTQLTAAERDPSSGLVVCQVEDLTTGIKYIIKTRFLFGADGGRSQVSRSFGFTLQKKPSQAAAVNVLFNADLEHLMRSRGAQLHWITRPDIKSRFGPAPLIRMVRPWSEWMMVLVIPGSSENIAKTLSPDDPELNAHIKTLIGDDTVDVKVLRVDGWFVRENVADRYGDGQDVFILGDAAHQHPPTHGLGSNTCIQDAYNLGWKAAYVSKGYAGPGLLDTFSVERQPVGASLVAEANECFRESIAISDALGLLAETADEGARQISELYEQTDEGTARRTRLWQALERKKREGHAMGLAMNQFYVSSAVYLDDETEPRPEIVGDHVTTIQISTYPGSRLPHAWIDVPTLHKEISTHDVAGKGSFVLFYGPRGQEWAAATANIATRTGIPLKSVGIGFGLEYHDVYRMWQNIRGIEEDGCVLVRPDRFVAWRSKTMHPESEAKLATVLDRVLSREGLVG